MVVQVPPLKMSFIPYSALFSDVCPDFGDSQRLTAYATG